MLSPSYGMYRVSAAAHGAAVAVAPLRADFTLDRDALTAVLEGTDLVFLCSPNNPTGTVIERDAIERLLAEFSGLVAIDEAYGEFAEAEGVLRRSSWSAAASRTWSCCGPSARRLPRRASAWVTRCATGGDRRSVADEAPI